MAQEDGNAVEDHDPFEVALRSLPLEEPRRGWDGKGPKGFKRPVELDKHDGRGPDAIDLTLEEDAVGPRPDCRDDAKKGDIVEMPVPLFVPTGGSRCDPSSSVKRIRVSETGSTVGRHLPALHCEFGSAPPFVSSAFMVDGVSPTVEATRLIMGFGMRQCESTELHSSEIASMAKYWRQHGTGEEFTVTVAGVGCRGPQALPPLRHAMVHATRTQNLGSIVENGVLSWDQLQSATVGPFKRGLSSHNNMSCLFGDGVVYATHGEDALYRCTRHVLSVLDDCGMGVLLVLSQPLVGAGLRTQTPGVDVVNTARSSTLYSHVLYESPRRGTQVALLNSVAPGDVLAMIVVHATANPRPIPTRLAATTLGDMTHVVTRLSTCRDDEVQDYMVRLAGLSRTYHEEVRAHPTVDGDACPDGVDLNAWRLAGSVLRSTSKHVTGLAGVSRQSLAVFYEDTFTGLALKEMADDLNTLRRVSAAGIARLLRDSARALPTCDPCVYILEVANAAQSDTLPSAAWGVYVGTTIDFKDRLAQHTAGTSGARLLWEAIARDVRVLRPGSVLIRRGHGRTAFWSEAAIAVLLEPSLNMAPCGIGSFGGSDIPALAQLSRMSLLDLLPEVLDVLSKNAVRSVRELLTLYGSTGAALYRVPSDCGDISAWASQLLAQRQPTVNMECALLLLRDIPVADWLTHWVDARTLSQELAKAGPWSVDSDRLPAQYSYLDAWRDVVLKHKVADWPEQLICKVKSMTEAAPVVRTGPTSHKPGTVYALLEETHDGGVKWEARLYTGRAVPDPSLPVGVFPVSSTSATGEKGSVGYRLQLNCGQCKAKHRPFTKATDDPEVAAEALRRFAWPAHNGGQCGLKVSGVFVVQSDSEGAAASGGGGCGVAMEERPGSSAVPPPRARSAPARKQRTTPFSERELASLWLLDYCNRSEELEGKFAVTRAGMANALSECCPGANFTVKQVEYRFEAANVAALHTAAVSLGVNSEVIAHAIEMLKAPSFSSHDGAIRVLHAVLYT